MPDFGRWTSNGGDPSLNEINRTDRFLDALASQQPVYSTDSGEAELAHLLAGWRDEVRDAPLRAVVTPRDAVIALDRATTTRKRRRTSMAVVGSLAAAVLCLGGFGAVIAGAGPGDPLYGLRTMLFGDQAPRTDAVTLASQQLAEVQQLIDQGQWEAAQDKLQTLTTTVATVNDVEQKQELVEQWQDLTVKVETKDANATVPPNVPPPTFPDVPVVVLDTTTSTTTSSATTSPSETTSPSATTSPSETTSPSATTSPSETTTSSVTTSPSETTTPSTPLPTPSTPLPTPTPSTPLPSPTPTAYSPLPTPTAYTPIPTPTALPTPVPTPAAEQEEQDEGEPATTEPPVLEAPAPKTVVTTTVV
ncbi:MAG TPA: anti-sigma-D factor RsdA, partial [Mycobacterium sp.]|nr:anti-sigma-D factor RsdA [Mycobacterium sp.]